MNCPARLSSNWATIPHDLLAIFFGFGEDAVEGGTTYYFDDVYFGEAPVTNNVEAARGLQHHHVPEPCRPE